MTQIRVLEIISGFAVEGPLGGIERFGIELAQALVSMEPTRIEPIVTGMWAYGTQFEYNWINRLQDNGIRAFILADWDEVHPYDSFFRAYRSIRKIMRGDRVDIIHSHCQFGDLLALLLQRPLHAKALVRTVHNEREWGKRPLRRLLLTSLLYPLLFDLELGVAQQVVNNLNQRSIARLLQKKPVRAYNALNFQRFEQVNIDVATKLSSLGLPQNAQVVGTVGRLTKQKGYSYLIEAAVSVLKQLPQTYFVFIGSGELENSLKERARKLGIQKHTIFTGPRNDIEELLKVMNVFVNSSLWEGLPTVMLESMAAETPVVATQVSGNIELIQDGETGHLVPPGEPQQLAAAIISVLKTPPEQISIMCKKACQFVQENFSISKVAKQHQALYLELLQNKPAG